MKHLLITLCCLLATASAANAVDIPGLGGGDAAPFKQKNTYNAATDDPNVYYGTGGGVPPGGSVTGATIPAATPAAGLVFAEGVIRDASGRVLADYNSSTQLFYDSQRGGAVIGPNDPRYAIYKALVDASMH